MAVADARARLDDGVAGAESLAALEAELRRVQGWAASFGLRELKLQSGKLATRVRRWVDDPELERAERAAIMVGAAERLTVLAAERPARPLAVSAPHPAPHPAPSPAAPPVPAAPPAPVDSRPPVRPAAPVAVRGSVADAPDVVVVQDDRRMTALLMFGLEHARLRVTTFESGTAALEALRHMPARPGRPIVILDVELPGLDGHDVHERLRAERPGVFSFVFTAAPLSEGERMRAVNAGALDYLMRPISLRTLMDRIPRWLAASAARTAPPPVERRRPVIIGRRSA